MNNISFQAHVVATPKIPVRVRVEGNKKRCKTYGSIVQLDISSTGNMRLLNRVANQFQENIAVRKNKNEYNYANDVRNNFNRIFCSPGTRENEDFYVYTIEELNKEEEEFDTMDPDKVVGVAQVNNDPDKNSCEIKYFNIDPRTNYNSENRQCKETGKSFLTGLHDVVHKNTIVNPDENAVGFYLKLGYKELPSGKLIHRYRENAST